MAYDFYLDGVQLPIPPPKLEIKVTNKNKIVDLINTGEVNILKKEGLSEISFEAEFTHNKLPFYRGAFRDVQFFLSKLELLKTDCKPFQFIVSRELGNKVLFNTNIKVSLEEYAISEDAENGSDTKVAIKLKQYRDYSTKKLVLAPPKNETDRPNVKIEPKRVDSVNATNTKTKTYTVKAGDSLWSICQKQLGNGSLYKKVYELNKSMMDKANKGKNLSKYTIYKGQVLKLG
ncbi:TPA: LysM peptidoglycan-binding domain-containing protein [Clostridioides difficile]|uniref:LysM peptidoglycan-binding domain-containing protein n=16 Tax=Clostridioides difficile TaxID=1496 RepID=A0AAN6A5A1_CLODI|nr:LysM peptidoglycan-binding domain-containing protein [Clostridioides difficile]AMM56423.1 peptidoglycan-binding protein [Clostridioides difficile]EGT3830281.1 LysM peptidoglycan-binding domain-containing protein [Clostridioides difficile]EGT4194062.1 LysM peptidoglycan-binding domain-containing protein [Clostridioides difficile]EGT4514195.1 LysM peptidoglycan-binding domain-containing protein [Clostridioides difficile]EGT4587296.1 LysM peptidoglycan-binding domain-containing protein [Clostr